MHHVTATDKTKLGHRAIAYDRRVPIDASSRAAVKGIKHGKRVDCDGAPHGVFATHRRRLTQDLIDFIGR